MLFSTVRFSFVAAVLCLVLAGQSVSADTFICDDDFLVLGPTDVVDDVLILNGGVLLMTGTTVRGDIEIESGGTLAASQAKIAGHLEAESAFLIDLNFCDIGGSVELKRTGGSGDLFGLLPSINLHSCHILGNLKVSRSDVNSITITDNLIQGKLELSRNSSTLPIVVQNNTVLRRKVCD